MKWWNLVPFFLSLALSAYLVFLLVEVCQLSSKVERDLQSLEKSLDRDEAALERALSDLERRQ